MKSIVLLLLFLMATACDTVKDLPKTTDVNASQNDTVQNSENDLPNQRSGIPGRISFKAKVVKTYASKMDICGVSRPNVIELEVIEILESGSGIANLPHQKDILSTSFLLTPKDLSPNMQIRAKAKESLCPETSETYFTVNSYELLE